jgi:hypothetical protein
VQRLIALALLVVALAACASSRPAVRKALPELRLAPSALGREVAWQQRLQFAFDARVERVDALLEVDAEELRLVLHRLGQVALRLRWDGYELSEERSPNLPESLQATRVLSDLQFVYWPVEAVQAGLPDGWTATQRGAVRELHQGGELVARAEYYGTSRATLHQRRFGYRLEIETQVVSP